MRSMIGRTRDRLKSFEVTHQGYYHEFDEIYHTRIKARNQADALGKFASRHRIAESRKKKPENWEWWDGDWYMVFVRVQQLKS